MEGARSSITGKRVSVESRLRDLEEQEATIAKERQALVDQLAQMDNVGNVGEAVGEDTNTETVSAEICKYLSPYLDKLNDTLRQLGGRQKEIVVLDKGLFEEIIRARCEKECLACGKCPAAAGQEREPKERERKRKRESSPDDVSISATTSSSARPVYSNRRRRHLRHY
jgi:hypothetical protein